MAEDRDPDPALDGEARLRLRPPRLLAGQGESIFGQLPESVLQNLWNPASETALLWNLMYPLVQPSLKLEDVLKLRPLWGSAAEGLERDLLTPYFWGLDLQGRRLPGLDQTLGRLDGSGPYAEVDLFLLGEQHLVLVEAKHLSGLGRCGRHQVGRCPEIHRPGGEACRYWEEGPAAFSTALDFGARPTPDLAAPPCSRHYQLGRLLLLGRMLAERLDRRLHLWLLIPQQRWAALAGDWLDFASRVGDQDTWRKLRVIGWEQLRSLPPPQMPR